jgi:hypothetical protein
MKGFHGVHSDPGDTTLHYGMRYERLVAVAWLLAPFALTAAEPAGVRPPGPASPPVKAF